MGGSKEQGKYFLSDKHVFEPLWGRLYSMISWTFTVRSVETSEDTFITKIPFY